MLRTACLRMRHGTALALRAVLERSEMESNMRIVGIIIAVFMVGCSSMHTTRPPQLVHDRLQCVAYAWQRCAGIESCERHNEKECLAELGWARTRDGWERFQTERDRAIEVEHALRARGNDAREK
jgi:hypothetical protein